jgi:hypothetical protein
MPSGGLVANHNRNQCITSTPGLRKFTINKDLPGHHLLAARNLIATTNDESYHDSASELPPATSHGYAE